MRPGAPGRLARAAALIALMLVAACAPLRAPMGPERVEPSIAGDHWHAADGTAFRLTRWSPEGRPRAIILALHGYNDYRMAFRRAGQAWATEGVLTVAYDQRGFGSTPSRGVWPGTETLVSDATTLARLLRLENPGVPLFLLGHSMGGAVAVVALAQPGSPLYHYVEGAILVAPAAIGFDELGPLARFGAKLGEALLGRMRFTGAGLAVLPTDNPEVWRELSEDPMVIKGSVGDMLAGLLELMTEARLDAAALREPTLVLFGANEEIVPEWAVRAFVAEVPPGPVRLARYPEGWHLLLRDLKADIVWRDILAWIEDREAPLPSGAEIPKEDFLRRLED